MVHTYAWLCVRAGGQAWVPKVQNGELLDKEKPVLVLCHAGVRSMNAATFLETEAGFGKVYNIDGGISVYANRVDPSVFA